MEYLKISNDVSFRINADLENLPVRDEVVDICICTDVIEHVMNDKLVIEKISKTIKSDGVLFLATPWQQDLSVYDLPEYKSKYAKYKYVHLRSIDENYMVSKIYPFFRKTGEQLITDGMALMEFKPYPIKLHKLIKR